MRAAVLMLLFVVVGSGSAEARTLSKARAERHARVAVRDYSPGYADRHRVRRCKRANARRFHCSGRWSGPTREGRFYCTIVFDVYVRKGERRVRHSPAAKNSTCGLEG